ncbi:MAG: sigma-70 family RNA polymerase sigma factor [Phycisphaerales bacterium]|jgi:RNA polymerase sigma factor (sigma-70 family)|nr:sigma-70 family RNA polymerase sigma factor [Phycisphaerales bacterium]
MTTPNQEQQLVTRCLDGDADAHETLYARYAPAVMIYCKRCGFTPHDVSDMLQITFTKVFKSLHTYKPARARLGTWIGAIARNAAYRQWRKRQQPESCDEMMADYALESQATPEELTAQREEFSALDGCVDGLEITLTRIVRLRFVEGLTTRGISRRVNMAESTVRKRLAEAMAHLSVCMKGKGFFA